MTSPSNAATKKIRSEYMKRFREPKWETFTKCYEDSVKYRVSRRLMEHTHRPLFGDGWDSGTDSSGRSSPRVKGVPESLNAHPSSSESADVPRVSTERDTDTTEHELNSLPVENGYQHVTANGPSALTLRPRHRTPRSEPSFPQRELDTDESTDSTLRKPTRAKSQPPASTAERTSNRDNRRSNIRFDWTERSMEAREKRRLNMKGSASAGEVSTKPERPDTMSKKGGEFKTVDDPKARSIGPTSGSRHAVTLRNVERPQSAGERDQPIWRSCDGLSFQQQTIAGLLSTCAASRPG